MGYPSRYPSRAVCSCSLAAAAAAAFFFVFAHYPDKMKAHHIRGQTHIGAIPSAPFLPYPQRKPPRKLTLRKPSFSCLGISASPIFCSSRSRSIVTLKLNEAEEEDGEEEKKQTTKPELRRAYPFHEIEPRWQRFWEKNRTFRTPDDDIDTSKPKYYVLDMFPYPRFSSLCSQL